MGVKMRQKDGKWYVFINHKGKRKAKCVGDSKRAAEEVKRKLEAKLTLGELALQGDKPAVPTFGQYAEQWLTHYVSVACKASSQRIIRGMVRTHLLPAFGAQDLRSITRAQVKAFAWQKQQRYTAKYVKNLVRTLHTICEHAIDEEVLDRNPAAKLEKYIPEKRFDPEQAITPFTSAEVAHYLATMRAHYPQHYAYFLCLARTGMREGEALGLYWEDVQFGQDAHDPHRFLHVQRTYDPVHRVYNTPKNGHSRRVDMSQELRTALIELRNQRFDMAVLHGKTAIPPVIFCNPQGRPLAAAGLYKVHRRVCALAGLRASRVHDLRHSYATIQLYEHHAPIQYVSEQLGHASIKITGDTYGHPRQGTSITLADRLDSPARSTVRYATLAQPDRSIRRNTLQYQQGKEAVMKAVRIHAFGGPEVVTYEEIPQPVPKAQEVLFKVTSTCVNYADVQWRLGNYVDRTLPATLGREAAGIIEAVGPGVTTLRVGQPIMARAIGGNAEYAIAQVQNVFPCPAGLNMAQAGGIPIVFLTAYHLLRSLRPVQPGDTVLVQAAASGVGTVLIQLCKQWGFRSIATASTAAKLELARSLGADVTINYTTQDFEAEVKNLTHGAGVQLALEAVGGEVTLKSMRCLAPFGCLVNYGNASNQPAALPLSSFREQRAAMGFSLPAMSPRSDNQAAMAEILDLITAGKVRLIVDQVLPLSEAAKAHAHLSNRGTLGKVLLIP